MSSLLKNVSGSLELDRIQLVRRPQVGGGATEGTKEEPIPEEKE
jgi:hypothetical protein